MMQADSTTPIEADDIKPLSGAWFAANPRLAALLTFTAGLLLGWWVLGWWLWPVRWDDAQPYHLRADLRADWVQLVANDYQVNGQLDRAAQRLTSLDPAILAATTDALQVDPARSAGEHANVRQLAQNLQAGGFLSSPAAAPADASTAAGAASPPATGAAAAPSTDPVASAVDAQDLLRILALAVAVGALAGLAFLAGSLLLGRVRESAASRLGGSLPAGRGLRERATASVGLGDDLRPTPGGAPDAARGGGMRSDAPRSDSLRADTARADTARSDTARSDTARFDPLARTQGMPALPSQATAALTGLAGVSSRAAASRQAPAWRPNRIEIDQTVDARYQEGDTQSILTWLVYGSRGALIGGAGLLAQPIGGVNTIDLWFADRDDVDQTRKTPTVTFITTQVYQDPVLRARLSDRRLIPAVPGRRLRLETAELWLDVEVIEADPTDASAHPSLQGLVLALTPHQRLDAAAGRPPAEVPADDDGGWEAALDEEIDDAFQPSRPLPFRRE